MIFFFSKGLSEWYSPVIPGSGLHPRAGSAASLKAFFQEVDPKWTSVWYPSQRGEDVPELKDRTDGFIEVFIPEIERMGAGKHTHVLLVSHAATIIALTGSLLGDRELPLRVGCCTLTEVVPRVQSSQGKQGVCGAWEATKLADGAHLEKGALRDWGLEDIEIAAGKVRNILYPEPKIG
jgi:transcription factor C subunit 7